MEKLENNWQIILGLIALSLALVYFILPKIIKNYSSEKAIKLLLLYGMMTYLSIDFYRQEKYGYIAFFVVGAVLYTYLVFIAKRKS